MLEGLAEWVSQYESPGASGICGWAKWWAKEVKVSPFKGGYMGPWVGRCLAVSIPGWDHPPVCEATSFDDILGPLKEKTHWSGASPQDADLQARLRAEPLRSLLSIVNFNVFSCEAGPAVKVLEDLGGALGLTWPSLLATFGSALRVEAAAHYTTAPTTREYVAPATFCLRAIAKTLVELVAWAGETAAPGILRSASIATWRVKFRVFLGGVGPDVGAEEKTRLLALVGGGEGPEGASGAKNKNKRARV